MKIVRVAIFGSGNSNMTFVFEIDAFLVNYSYMMTNCQFHIRRSRKYMKIVRVAIFGSGNSNMTLVFEIDAFLVNYS